MNKLKISKSVKKRYKITSTMKILRHRASRSHLLQKKTSKRKQSLRKLVHVSSKDISNLKQKISYLI